MVATQQTPRHELVDLQELKSRYNLADVVEAAGVKLNGAPNLRQGACPFHGETKPSFTVYANTQRFYCFGCHIHGDLYEFVQRMENLDLNETVERLKTGAAYRNIAARRPVHPVQHREQTQRDTRLLTTAMRYYYHQLHDGDHPEGAEYLESRGIRPDTARREALGYSSGAGLNQELMRQGFTQEQLRASGLFTPTGERFANMVVIPAVNPHSRRVEWMVGRTTNPQAKPRFNTLPGAKPLLGMARLGLTPPWVVLTEGLFDWVTLMQWGYPAVAMLGTGGVERTAENLRGCKTIFLAFDNDEGGRVAARDLEKLLGLRATRIHLPLRAGDIGDMAAWPDGATQFQAALVQAAYDRGHSAARQ